MTINFRDEVEAQLWVQWGSIYMNVHKMTPVEAAEQADSAVVEFRKRKTILAPQGTITPIKGA